MRITVEGLVYQLQTRGGISRVLNEVLPRVCAIEPSFDLRIVLNGDSIAPLPPDPPVNRVRAWRPNRWLRPTRLWTPVIPFLEDLFIGSAADVGDGGLWHSTYYRIPRGLSQPVVGSVWDMTHERFPHLLDSPEDQALRKAKKRTIERSTILLTISAAAKDDLIGVYGTDLPPVEIMHLAPSACFLPLDDIPRPARVSGGKPYMLYVGSRAPYKNFPFLLDTYSRWEGAKDVALVVVGTSWTPPERSNLETIKAAGDVVLVEGVSDEELARLYTHARAFIYPSLSEGFGIPILEALGCGCPVLASDIEVFHEVGGECIVYFDPADEESLLEGFDVVMELKNALSWRKTARDRAESFTWEGSARRLLDIYLRAFS